MPTEEQWDIVSGVGITALGVAAARSIETRRIDGLVTDPYADMLVRAADADVAMPGADTDDTSLAELWDDMVAYIGVRSRYFDEWFRDVCADGVRQAVILASGLDTRAFRLSWPGRFHVFEIDQPKVLEFKNTVLAEHGVDPTCERHSVAVDLRDDWASWLEDAGFDATRPTAWLAEGLLPYLPADAEQRLLDTVHRLSAPGSHLCVEGVTRTARASLLADDHLRETSQAWGIDMMQLFNTEERADPGDRMSDLGWRVRTDASIDVAARLGRELKGLSRRIADEGHMLAARLPA